ncbi:MAG: radical SAM protein [Desulfovibrio sp.]|nr:MAG: radical SAM protein [Desulfovibrio sp.]
MIRFIHPEPRAKENRILPVFLPYSGCPQRCVYCAQDKQTGVAPQPLNQALSNLQQELQRLSEANSWNWEIAFYGATFTAIEQIWQERFLALANEFRTKGLLSRIRCSTRPDALTPQHLAWLAEEGLDMVEVGVQSFANSSLALSQRHYCGEAAREACCLVREAGLALGVQLMPGLPGSSGRTFLADVETTCDLAPEAARLYPLLVLQGSELEDWWRQGQYQALGLGKTVPLLALACLKLWRNGIRVIRMGLAPEPEMKESILAGPWHPALGLMVRALALYYLIKDHVAALGTVPSKLWVPKRFQGEIMGHGAELKRKYAGLGLSPEKIGYWEEEEFQLE